MFAVVHTRASIGVSAPSVTVEVHLSGGLPALSMPAGLVDGKPVGVQLIGKAFDETGILSLAHQFQSLTDHHVARPEGF